MLSCKQKFYFILCIELLFWPFLWLRQQVRMSLGKTQTGYRNRKPIENQKVTVNIHEWGGYDMVRRKTIKNGATFECGIKGQLERFSTQPNVDLFVTISDVEKHKDITAIASQATVIEVSNSGMDFSGYFAIYDRLKDQPNHYIILTNSSVNAVRDDFLDGYINYMNNNVEVGMLGVSYCTKMVQTLVRRNFTPHLQSFFVLTTVDVLREIMTINGGKFPGKDVDHKLLLIRKGEIRLSKLVQKAGYRLAVVNPMNGEPYEFECFNEWKLPYGDIRQKINIPNRITPIKL